MFTKRPFVILMIVVLTLPALAISPQAGAQTDYWPTEGWLTSTPEEQGIDSAQLLKALDVMEENALVNPVHSVLLIRHGYVVLDASIDPFSVDQPHAMYSVTKSFLSTLVGIAIDKGYIKGVDQSIWDFFDKAAAAEMDERKEAMVLEHLLTMTSGLRLYDDVDIKMYRLTGDDQPWVQFLLDRRMLNEPGTSFTYADGVAHLTSAIVSKATGMSAFEFAQQNLFAPLGIRDVTWLADPQGVSLGGDGLHVNAYDMAKLGYLYLHQGEWDGQQVVSAQWVAAATRSIKCPGCPTYGYYWWLADQTQLTPETPNFYAAVGYAGQQLVVLPEKDLIIVLTGGSTSAFSPEDTIISEAILPAVQSDTPLPANPDAVAELTARVEALAHPEPAAIPPMPAIAQQVSGQTYLLSENPMNWTSIAVEFGEPEALLKLQTSDGLLELPVGLDGVYRVTPVKRPVSVLPLVSTFWQIPRPSDDSLALKGRWRDDTAFVVWMRDLAGLETWVLTITYGDNEIKFFAGEGVQSFSRTVSGTPQP